MTARAPITAQLVLSSHSQPTQAIKQLHTVLASALSLSLSAAALPLSYVCFIRLFYWSIVVVLALLAVLVVLYVVSVHYTCTTLATECRDIRL